MFRATKERAIRKFASIGLMLGGLGVGFADTSWGQQPTASMYNDSAFNQSLRTEAGTPVVSGSGIEQTAWRDYRYQPPCGSCNTVPAAPACGSCGTCGTTGCACAPAIDPCYGRLQSIFNTDCCGGNLLDNYGLTLGGWTSFGYTWNPDRPASRVNGPVTFNDRSNDFLFNQLNIVLARDVDTNSDSIDFGGRADFMVGSDTRFTKSAGFDDGWGGNRQYSIAMPQLYAEAYLPFLTGITVKAGHFYTIMGYETVTAPDNFFYSHSYTMQYGEPFTHWGIMSSTQLTDSLKIISSTVTGWDNLENPDENFSFMGGVTYTSPYTNTSVALSLITGNEFVPDVQNPIGKSNRTMYSIVVSQPLGDKWTYVLQHDHGWQNDAIVLGGGGTQDAEWYGINQYLFYTINDKLRAGARAEWFRDDDGVRVTPGVSNAPFVANGTNYYEVSLGLNWSVTPCIMLRPEVRYDWAGNGARPYDDGTDAKQWLFATDAVIKF